VEDERTVRKITWMHDGDECVAEVGQPLKWQKIDPKMGRPGMLSVGQTVVGISPGPPCWMVVREPTEGRYGDGWANPIMCGDTVEVEYLDEEAEGH
jgi:hypothetical protein